MSREDAGTDLVTFGEAMVLLLAEPGIPIEHAQRFERLVAGAEANVAIGLARLGYRTRFIGRIGSDALGLTVLRTLKAEGVEVSDIVTDPAATGVIIRDTGVARPVEVIYHRAGAAGSHIVPEDLPKERLTDARVVLSTGITPALSASAARATRHALAAAREAGVTTAFDPNFRRRLRSEVELTELLRPISTMCDIVLASLDEALLLSGCGHREAAADWFLQHGSRVVVVKDGARGVWATDGVSTWERPACVVHVVDPIGAGDAFNAGFLAAWLDGADIETGLQWGSHVAACVVQVRGDTDGLPTRSTLDLMLQGVEEARR